MFTTRKYKETLLLDKLREIKLAAWSGALASCNGGICYLCVRAGISSDSLVKKLTGTSWPISKDKEISDYFFDVWIGWKLEARLSLLQAMINYLEAPWWKRPFIRKWKVTKFLPKD